ncbi:MAG: class I SAM-dependent methyltransferase [Dehalococcoidia bacterium]|nr:class I SAM-dependent methyltransferase [Dehalococcoidia bacterium]
MMRHTSSFRDPDGAVVVSGERVFRAFLPTGAEKFALLKASGLLEALQERGLVVDWREIPPEDVPGLRDVVPQASTVLEHTRIPFLSFCYEWPFSMLKDAALCTLDIAQRALAKGFILKDATPFNIQFLGTRPVLIDLASLEPYQDGQPWRAYHQFCRLFLNPLLLQASTGAPFQPWLRGSLEGIAPADMARLLPWRWRMRPFAFTHVLLQAWLERQFAPRTPDETDAPPRVRRKQVLTLLHSLARGIEHLRPRHAPTPWTGYQEECHYHPEAQKAKATFVEQAVQTHRPRMVWDLGCHVGHYSRLAGRYAGLVVGMDSDPHAVDTFYQQVKGKTTNILPLVIDVLDPSPDRGWAQEERQGLIARGPADMVLCLALVHHLALQGNVPFGHLVRWLAHVGHTIIIEFVPKEDSRARLLLRWREDVYPWYTQQAFERALEERFTIVERYPLPHSTRILYRAVRRGG